MSKKRKDAVVVAIIDKKDRLLVLKRSEGSRLQGWCLPGGMVEDDEHGQDEFYRLAACREVLEETGIRLNPDELNWAGFAIGSRGEHICLFWVETPEQEVKLSEEHQGYVWVFVQVLSMFGASEVSEDYAGKTAEFIETILADRKPGPPFPFF